MTFRHYGDSDEYNIMSGSSGEHELYFRTSIKPKKIKCSYCKRKVHEDTELCPGCGAPIEDALDDYRINR